MGKRRSRSRDNSRDHVKSKKRRSAEYEREISYLKRKLAEDRHQGRRHFRSESRSPSSEKRVTKRRLGSRSPAKYLRVKYPKRASRDRTPVSPASDIETPNVSSGRNSSCSTGSPKSHYSPLNSAQNSPIDHIEPNDSILINNDETLEEDVLLALGENVSEQKENTFALHPVLQKRGAQILKNGLDQNERNEIVEKCQSPLNLDVKAPALNNEVISAISAFQLKRDQHQSDRQELLGKGISLLGKALTAILRGSVNSKEDRNIIISTLGDAGKIITDVHHSMSTARRAGITPIFGKNIKDLLSASEVEGFLFGQDLGERFKTVKAVEKTAKDFKQEITSNKPPTKQKSAKTLNSKAPSRYHQRRDLRPKGRFPHHYKERSQGYYHHRQRRH